MRDDTIFDIALVLIIIVIGATSTFTSLAYIDKKITNYTMGDKSTITGFAPEKVELVPEDILLMYVVADEYQPTPAKLQINNGAITSFEKSYFLDTNTAINNLWNSEIKDIMNKKIVDFSIVYDSNGGNLRWKVTTD